MEKVEMSPDTPQSAQEPIVKNVSEAMDAKEPQTNIKKRIIRIQFDIEYQGSQGKEMDPKSTTMPDMNLTVRQLLENHSRGIDDKTQVRQPLYFETEIPTLNDITDVQQFKAHLEERLQTVNQFIRQERDEINKKNQQEVTKHEQDNSAEKK